MDVEQHKTYVTDTGERASEANVIFLGNSNIPEEHRKILQLGPSFCLEPVLTPPE